LLIAAIFVSKLNNGMYDLNLIWALGEP